MMKLNKDRSMVMVQDEDGKVYFINFKSAGMMKGKRPVISDTEGHEYNVTNIGKAGDLSYSDRKLDESEFERSPGKVIFFTQAKSLKETMAAMRTKEIKRVYRRVA